MLRAQPYERSQLGPLSFHSVSYFVEMLLMRIDPSQAEALENARAERAGKRAKTSAAEVPQVTSENWATICAADSSLLCAIAMLDPSAATFDADLKLAHAVAGGADPTRGWAA